MARRLCLLLAVWTGWVAGQSSPYCSFTSRHTLCKFSGVGPRCGSQVMARGVGAQDAAAIVAQHNQLRSRVAMGQERRGDPGPQPQAANMRLLEWDDELAVVAQGHADQCVFEHECSDCRRVSRFGVGQNLFISFQSNFDTQIQWKRAIKAWYDEVVDFDPSDIKPFQFSTAVGHYTQMMWWNTYTVGCGFTMYEDGGWWKKLYTCNYGPGGNIIFSQMYRRGSPCSSCPEGTTCSLQYSGLCGAAFATRFPTNQVAGSRGRAPTAQEEENMFIPFNGNQPSSSDLMPFLQRAGMDTQVIRTTSLSNVQNIINALPANLKPIVLFRSGSGQLTELDAKTLVPLQRFGRSTTTKGPRKRREALLTCDLDFSPCEVMPIGGNWTVGKSDSEGMYAEAVLEEGEGAQVVVEEMVEAPSSETVCVALSHRRSLFPGAPDNATIPELQVGVMPLGGEVNRMPVLGAPGVWEMSRVTLRNVKTPFLLVMTVGPATEPATVALDAFMVTDGVCCLSGKC